MKERKKLDRRTVAHGLAHALPWGCQGEKNYFYFMIASELEEKFKYVYMKSMMSNEEGFIFYRTQADTFSACSH